jgi:FAD synthase
LDRLRDEQHFESLERLKDQIELDVQEAARVLSEETDLGRDMV